MHMRYVHVIYGYDLKEHASFNNYDTFIVGILKL